MYKLMCGHITQTNTVIYITYYVNVCIILMTFLSARIHVAIIVIADK